jgi:hypothetical protein
MVRMNFFTAIPIIILLCISIYGLIDVLREGYLLGARNYIAFLLFIIDVYFWFKKYRISILFTGLILALATFNLIVFTPQITGNSFGIGPVHTPYINLLSLGILFLYLILHFNFLLNWYWDYKEGKKNQ